MTTLVLFVALLQSTTIRTYVGPNLPSSGSQAITQTIGVPEAVTPDGMGGFYVSTNQDRVYHVASDGILTVIAGVGSPGVTQDGVAAVSAKFNYVHGIAVDANGEVFVADTNNGKIREITTVAGNSSGFSGDGGPAVSAQLSDPRGVAVDTAGNVFIADSGNTRIRMINTGGFITTVAGSTPGFSGDGGLATSAQLGLPM